MVDAFNSLGAKVNKVRGDTTDELSDGIVGPKLLELKVTDSDEELLKTAKAREAAWNGSEVKSKWVTMGDENEKYWKGNHYNRPEVSNTRAVMDNAIYEGLETYLPQVTRRNPEPMVSLAVGELQPDDVEAGNLKQEFAHALQLELGELADELKMRLKLKEAARHKEIYLLGAMKFSWDVDNDRPKMTIVRPRKLILDPDSSVDSDGYTGEAIGEHRKLPASKIIDAIDKDEEAEGKTKVIKDLVKDNLATEVAFVEWWTRDLMFWKLDNTILLKKKNPHWNYEQEQMPEMPQQEQQFDEAGQPIAMPEVPMPEPVIVDGVNHFVTKRMPYILLATMTLGAQPVDMTSNIGQNLSNQDLINKRVKQIDKTADSSIGGLVVSLERAGLTADQAKGVTSALRNNGVVAIPTGAPQEAVWKPPSTELPAYVYTQLSDTRNRVRDIWGVRGSSPAGLETDTTVRGKMMSRGLDTDRIGGGISEYLEQFADDAYNWLVQMLYVYDDRFQQAIASGVPLPKVKVSVKEGSLLPKDSMTIANQAIELSGAGKMSTLDLYKKLDYPNPEELAVNAWLEVNAPEVLYENDPRVQQVMQQKQAAMQAEAQASQEQPKTPSESISYKDLPPEGQVQMAAQAGIDIAPEQVVQDKMEKEMASQPPVMPNNNLQ